MEPETQRLINILKATLRMLGVSRRQVARRIGMSPSYLSKLFAGVSPMRLDHVIQICQAADLEPAEFFSLAYPRQPSGSPLAAQKMREFLRTLQLPSTAASLPPTAEEELQMEEKVRSVLERVLGRRNESA